MNIAEAINQKTGRNDQTIAEALANWNPGSGIGDNDQVTDMIYRLAGYSRCKKVQNYLYECWYDRIDYPSAMEYFRKNGFIPSAGCSAVRSGNLIGRNFDWFYNKEAEFVVHTPAIGDHYASCGIACGADIYEEDADKFKADQKYSLLPFYLLDGINSKGVFAEINVVPKDQDEDSYDIAYPAEDSEVELNGIMIVRYILDNFDTAEKAVNYIHDHATVYFPDKLLDMNYKLHAMVCDSEDTYIIEFVDGETVIIEPDIPAITNFELDGVTFNEDNTVYTPATQDESHNAVDTNGIKPYGSGLERWNAIVEAYEDLDDADSVEELMTSTLKYSNAYSAGNEWYTEFVGGDLTCASTPEDFASIMERAAEAYAEKDRETAKVWHTTHSAIYNLSDKSLVLIPQESGNKYTFNF